MTLQELIDELNAVRDEYGGDLEFEEWDYYYEEYYDSSPCISIIPETKRFRIT